ncbi:MAG: HAD family hydrolase [Spirochaetaceae bacterium]
MTLHSFALDSLVLDGATAAGYRQRVLTKAILFDLDGTLLDTIEDIQSAANAALEPEGFSPITYEETRSRVGWGLRRLVEQSVPPGTPEEVIDRAFGELVRVYQADPTARSRIYDGIPELLDALTEAGMPMAVLSNKTHSITELVVAKLFGRWSFAVVHGAKEGVPPKPDPRSALSISEALGVPPEQMMFAGDTGVDMQTAKSAGMFPVGVSWGFRSLDELRSNGAGATVDDPAELLALIREEEVV